MSIRSCLIPLVAGLITFVCASLLLISVASAAGLLPFNIRTDFPRVLNPATPVPAPAVVPPAAAGTPEAPGRGTIERSSLLEVTLLSTRRTEDKPNTVTLAASLHVRNIADQPADVSGLLLQFRLVDNNGLEYGADVFNPDPNSLRFPIQNLARGTVKPLPAGSTVEGDLYFTVNRSANPVVLQWWPSPFEPRFRFPLGAR